MLSPSISLFHDFFSSPFPPSPLISTQNAQGKGEKKKVDTVLTERGKERNRKKRKEEKKMERSKTSFAKIRITRPIGAKGNSEFIFPSPLDEPSSVVLEIAPQFNSIDVLASRCTC